MSPLVRLLGQATDDVRRRWKALETVDVAELLLAVLPLRNLDVFEALWQVAQSHSIPPAELLLRPLLEGTVILEWCMRDPKNRGLRFRRTSFEGSLELIDDGLVSESDEYIASLRESVNWLKAEGYKRLPKVRQMIDDLDVFKPGVGYPVYKLLSKKVHAGIENWLDHADVRGVASATEREWIGSHRYASVVATAAFLAMRNILLLGKILPELDSAFGPRLEIEFATLYGELEAIEAEGYGWRPRA